MRYEVSPCRPDQLRKAVGILDQEFVLSRGRSVSLLARYPEALGEPNLQNIRVATVDQEIVSVAVAKPFTLLESKRRWSCAMIGLVHTVPSFQGQGLASRVLCELTAHLKGVGLDYAVLWASSPGLYEQLGWTRSDNSVYGEVDGASEDQREHPSDRVAVAPVTAGTKEEIERLRERWFPTRVLRSVRAYEQIPLPATSVSALTTCGDLPEGYALVGRHHSDGYLYEWCGSERALAALWQWISRSYCRIAINECEDTLSVSWLTEHSIGSLRPQTLAMWNPFSSASKARPTPHHIPFFDRL